MGKKAFVFPGQGSQHIGMGMDFYKQIKDSKRVFEEADDTLGESLSEMIFKGNEEDLRKTENTQPAILTASISMLKALEKEGVGCDYTAGLSLGEYSSLVMSKALNFRDALSIVRLRGLFMQEAVPLGIGGMIAIFGLDREELPLIISSSKKHGIVEVANYNSPEQIVLSGELKGLEWAGKEALRCGAKKIVNLSVSVPFHTSLLAPAGEKLKRELEQIHIMEPDTRVVANTDGMRLSSKDSISDKLVSQVSSSVLWQQSVELMLDEGVDTFIEIGPGKSLSGFIKRISKNKGVDVSIMNISDIESFENTVRKLEKTA